MLLIRSLLMDFLMYLLLLVMGILYAPRALWSVDGAYAGIKAYCRVVFWLLRVICGLRVEIRGPVPQDDVIVCSKHQSFLDIMMLAEALPRAKFIMKKELRWAPILGLYALRIGSTPVARGRKGAAMREMVSHAESRGEERPSQLVIYPQGTRVLPGATLPYKIGAGVLYDRIGAPCVPAATNVGVFWARRSRYRHPGLAVVVVPPLDEIVTNARGENPGEQEDGSLGADLDPGRVRRVQVMEQPVTIRLGEG